MTIELDDQQRVLSEVSHDLANRFHRSYYFLELLGEALDPSNAEAAPLLSGLRSTVEDIESTTRSTLEFLRVTELRLVQVSVGDLASSLRQHVGLRDIEILGEAAAGQRRVAVDPARISEALSILCSAVTAGGGEQSPVRVELIDGSPVRVRLAFCEGAGADGRSTLALALAARIARLHGGALDVEAGGAGALTLSLPVVNGGT